MSSIARPTNRAGGLEGGVTNGEELRVTGFMKPISTLMKPLRSVDLTTLDEAPAAIERSDVCAVTAAAVVGEAMVCLVLADAVLERFGGDSMRQLRGALPRDDRAVKRRLTRRSRPRHLLTPGVHLPNCANGASNARMAPICAQSRGHLGAAILKPSESRPDMLRPIVRYGEHVLHQPAAPVDVITPEIHDAHRRHDRDDVCGAGHRPGGAADRRRRCASSSSICRWAAIRLGLITMINPVFVERDGMQLEEEGCLSVPGFNATVARPERAVVRGLNRDGREHTREGTGLLARAFQHEMDHLDGRLFVDRLRGIKRDVIVRKIRKLSRAGRVVRPWRPGCASSFSARPRSPCRR